ncbi:cytochrome c1 [Frateuria aurantia]
MSRATVRRAWLAWAGVLMLAPSLAAASDPASLRRGERMFIQQCAACHSLRYLRYSTVQQDLGLSAQEMQDDLQRFQARPDAAMLTPMTAAIAKLGFAKMPPDLSLEVAVRGRSWVRQYLGSFYLDPSSPQGWNNPLLPNVAMPDPFWRQQGIRGGDGHGQPGAWLQPGELKPEAFSRQLDDLVDFLQYAATPDALKRRSLGPWVLLFLAVFTGLAYLLKRAWWRELRETGRSD